MKRPNRLTDESPLIIYRKREVQKVVDQGGEMFMGIPECWWDDMTRNLGCENGHVSRMVLKSEEYGDICLECHQTVCMIPLGHTDTTLKAELDAIASEKGN